MEKLGNITLYNADCLDIMREMPDNAIIVTDPPYNMNYHYNIYKDNKEENDYLEMLYSIFNRHRHIIIHYPEMLYKYAIRLGKAPDKVISWVYNANTPRQHRDIAFFGINPDLTKGKQEYKNTNDKRIKQRILEGKQARMYDWFEISQVKNTSYEKTEHPCQIPEKVIEKILSILPKDSIIIDPFMGSGTTAIVADKLKMEYIGIELDEKYYNISKQRLANHQLQTRLF